MRIGIVNDLSLARAVLKRLVQSVPEYSVAWEAVNGAEAITKAAADRPDVILMDLMMPAVDGAEATRRIMRESPCPILIVTSSVGAHHSKVYEALGAGGLDAVRTPAFGPGGQVLGGEPLLNSLRKVRQSLSQRMKKDSVASGSGLLHVGRSPSSPSLLAIGASTGGPEALATLLTSIGKDFPAPILIVQHIGSDYISGLVDWLRYRSGQVVELATPRTKPQAGKVYLAGGDQHLKLSSGGQLVFDAEPATYPHRPSVDVLFASLATNWNGIGVAVLLTGMGSDGAQGMLKLKNRGWITIGQDEASSVVYGMPKVAYELDACTEVLPLNQIGPRCRTLLTPAVR